MGAHRLVSLLVVVALTTAPLALPLLAPDELVRYQQALRIQPPRDYVSESGRLQESFGDMFGWEEMVRTVAAVYHALPPEEQSRAAIFAANYGEASAIDFFGPRYGLPKAICPNQTYFYWGPRQYTGDVMLVLGLNDAVLNTSDHRKQLEAAFRSVEYGPRVEHPYSMTWEHYSDRDCPRVEMAAGPGVATAAILELTFTVHSNLDCRSGARRRPAPRRPRPCRRLLRLPAGHLARPQAARRFSTRNGASGVKPSAKVMTSRK